MSQEGIVPAPTPAQTPAPAPAPAAEPWFKGADETTVGYISNRGLDKLSAREAALKAIEFHRNAEAKLGAPADKLLRIPDQNDEAGWAKLHAVLGKPEKPEAYDFSKVTDAADGFLDFARQWAYQHNLSKQAGEAFAADVSKWATEKDTGEQQEAAVKLEAERKALKTEWGFNERANLLTAQNAVRKLGIDPQAVATLEGKVGYAGVMKMFQKIGQALGEDTFITSEHTGNVMTREGAAAKIKELKADTNWVQRYNSGGTGSKEFKEMQDLLRIQMTPAT